MRRLVKSGNRRAMTGTSLLTLIGYVLGAYLLLFVILPIGGGFFGLTVGKTAEAASPTDGGFSRLMKQIGELKPPEPEGTQLAETITVDKKLYFVGFNNGDPKSVTALRPPECGAAACLCVCVNDDCTETDVDNNRGRDCKKLLGYDAIVAQQGVSSDEVKQATNYVDGSDGFFFYIKGFKTLSLTVQKKTVGPDTNRVTNLYIGKPNP